MALQTKILFGKKNIIIMAQNTLCLLNHRKEFHIYLHCKTTLKNRLQLVEKLAAGWFLCTSGLKRRRPPFILTASLSPPPPITVMVGDVCVFLTMVFDRRHTLRVIDGSVRQTQSNTKHKPKSMSEWNREDQIILSGAMLKYWYIHDVIENS